MEQIKLVEPQMKYADDIWEFRQEILECDAEDENQFAGCISLEECSFRMFGKSFAAQIQSDLNKE